MSDAGDVEIFGHAQDGTPVGKVTIAAGGAEATLISWGASLQDFRISGIDHPLVLGSPALEPYFDDMRYYGAIAGRVANRIANGTAELDGTTCRFDRNENGTTTLHGGSDGSSNLVWTIADHGASHCRFTLQMADGLAGFPGKLDVAVTYSLSDGGTLRIEIEARTDAPTFCNFAHHSYWNLDGTANLENHRLMVHADRYLAVDERLIPTGSPRPVDGTRFDLREPQPVIQPGTEAVDHNFCCFDAPSRELRKLAVLSTPDLSLHVASTEPGFQVYDGARMNTAPVPGLTGEPYGPYAGIALEPQRWPDAPNRPDYPTVVLRPGETYRQVSEFRIARNAQGS
ncbi:galactose mutarotase [Pseudohoeflea suaedae]|uniref:Aldose 1-epimerase n=1 Tax=Pseudohoeflea suaedae TaxID=877384 RepID=A0A4R5PLE1_9HYPH|nr:aldose epimerase family protein [Pseudohoeflea suaedae]TDH37638.1 galactose mutarotase [Pseudohoeflea suaedae]